MEKTEKEKKKRDEIEVGTEVKPWPCILEMFFFSFIFFQISARALTILIGICRSFL
jgi:hypothetical protein